MVSIRSLLNWILQLLEKTSSLLLEFLTLTFTVPRIWCMEISNIFPLHMGAIYTQITFTRTFLRTMGITTGRVLRVIMTIFLHHPIFHPWGKIDNPYRYFTRHITDTIICITDTFRYGKLFISHRLCGLVYNRHPLQHRHQSL